MEEGKLVVGLISGTSMDGIDVCIVQIRERSRDVTAETKDQPFHYLDFKVLGYLTHKYPPGLKEELLYICVEGKVQEISQYNVLLGQLFAEAVLKGLQDINIRTNQVDIIGSHGQTIYHQPLPSSLHHHNITSTFQIADPSVIAVTCGVTTVGDFRVADMAAGGQGAPLVPYLDQLLAKRHFASTGRLSIFLNIGGISNIFTVDHKTGLSIGFDTGPGNMLIDGLMKQLFEMEFDRGGQTASTGDTVDKQALEWLMDDWFISKEPPKSTGREQYNLDYIKSIIKRCTELNLLKENIISTVTAFTAQSIWYNYKMFIKHRLEDWNDSNIDLFVSGGGTKNKFLMRSYKHIQDPNFQSISLT